MINFPIEWQMMTLEMIARKDGHGFVDGPFGSNLPASEYVSFGIPVVRGANLSLGDIRFRDDEFVFVSSKTASRLERSLCHSEDIIFTKKGTLGQTAIIPSNHRYERFLLSSNQMKLSVNREIAEPLFVYYYVTSPTSRNKVIRDSEVTGVPKTNLTYFRKFPILLPPLPEQKAIARILGTLDDKIELNQKMNQTLEAMARAIFKSWFVDFDPVRAKMEGRQPAGMDAATAALFPDSFQDSPLGLIPKGWEVKPLPEVIDFLEGPGIRNWQYTNSDEGTKFINIRCIKNRDLILDTANRVADEEAYGKYKHFLLQEKDIVVSTSGTLGRLAIVRGEHLPLMLNTSVIRMRPITSNCSWEFLLGYIESNLFQEELNMRACGSVQKNFGPMHLKQMLMLLPPSEILTQHTLIVKNLVLRSLHNICESRTLSTLRNTLLPKLMSGEIRVAEAEEKIETIL